MIDLMFRICLIWILEYLTKFDSHCLQFEFWIFYIVFKQIENTKIEYNCKCSIDNVCIFHWNEKKKSKNFYFTNQQRQFYVYKICKFQNLFYNLTNHSTKIKSQSIHQIVEKMNQKRKNYIKFCNFKCRISFQNSTIHMNLSWYRNKKNWRKYQSLISSCIEFVFVQIWNRTMQNNIDLFQIRNDDIKLLFKKIFKSICTNVQSSQMIAFFNKMLHLYWFQKRIK